jgi:hypothetical protein
MDADGGNDVTTPANDDGRASSDALRCAPDALEAARAWLLVELACDDVDHGPLLADLAVCDMRISTHRIRPMRLSPSLRSV